MRTFKATRIVGAEQVETLVQADELAVMTNTSAATGRVMSYACFYRHENRDSDGRYDKILVAYIAHPDIVTEVPAAADA